MTPETEAFAVSLLKWAVTTFGPPVVMNVWRDMTNIVPVPIVGELADFVSSVLQIVRLVIADERVEAMLLAEYRAADTLVDAAEAKKFPNG